MADRRYEAWIIAAAGEDTSRRLDVPVENCPLQPWVRIRPLTAREALQREAVGLEEHYDLEPDGVAIAMRRTYDQQAMLEFELQRCLMDYELLRRSDDGAVELVGPDELPRDELLDVLPPHLIGWLTERLDEMNLRTIAAAEVLGEGKAV